MASIVVGTAVLAIAGYTQAIKACTVVLRSKWLHTRKKILLRLKIFC